MTNSPVTFGPGTTVKYISQTLAMEQGFFNYNLLGSNMISSVEFTQASLVFDYFRVEAVKIIFRAFNFTNTARHIYFRFKWGIEPMIDQELYVDDLTKMIGPVNMRPRVYTFVPPPIMCSVSSTNTKTIVMNDFQNVNGAYYPVSFAYDNGLTASVTINIEWKVRFRGASSYINSSKINKFLDAVNKINIKEDEKEEEIKEKRPKNMPTYKIKGIPSLGYQGYPPEEN